MSFVQRLIVEHLQAESLLDIGCGDGRLLHMLQGKVATLAGVDPVERALLFARAFNPDAVFYHSDVAAVPGTFAVTALIEVMEHIPDEEYPAFIANVAAKTAPNGNLVVSVPTVNIPMQQKHFRHYTLELLRQQLYPAFEIHEHWFLSRQGRLFHTLNRALLNPLGIVLSGKIRRQIWRLHRDHTFFADANSGRHLVALATPVAVHGSDND